MCTIGAPSRLATRVNAGDVRSPAVNAKTSRLNGDQDGEGPARLTAPLLGEQPGLAGRRLGHPAGQLLLAGVAPGLLLGLGRRCCGRRGRRLRLPLAPAASARSLLMPALTGSPPSCGAARRRRRRTSRGGTGWPRAGRSRPRRRTGRPPCSVQVTSGARGAAVGLQRPGADAVGVHEVEPLPLDAGEHPRAARHVDGVPAHVRDDRRLQPLDQARPLVAALGLDAVLDRRARRAPACRRRCRAPAGRPRAGARSRAGRRPRAARPCTRRTRPRPAPRVRRRPRRPCGHR